MVTTTISPSSTTSAVSACSSSPTFAISASSTDSSFSYLVYSCHNHSYNYDYDYDYNGGDDKTSGETGEQCKYGEHYLKRELFEETE